MTRPPSARDPHRAFFRTLPGLNRVVPGIAQSRAAQPLPRPLPDRKAAAGGDSEHKGSGTDSMAVGHGAVADTSSTSVGVDAGDLGSQYAVSVGNGAAAKSNNTAVGTYAEALDDWDGSTALGRASAAQGPLTVAVGDSAAAHADSATALGAETSATGARSVTIGHGATTSADDTGKVKVDAFEVEASSAAGAQTHLVLTDSAGTRWKIGVDTSGNPVPLGAA